jgi:predicted dehydrogenase
MGEAGTCSILWLGDALAQVVALCGRDRERAQPLAAKFAIPAIYTDYRQLFDEAQLDAVVISTPDDMHYEMVMAAFDAGFHVLCEKPLATNGAQAKAMLERAEAAGANTFYDGFKAQQVLDAAFASNRRGGWVKPGLVES